MSINQVSITGNLTRDPDLRSTAGGTAVLSFGIAVNDRRKNQQTGEREDVPNFFECVTFGNRATALSDILTKGMKVAVAGRLHYSSWEKDGQKHSKVDIIANDIELMQNRKPRQQQAYATPPQAEVYDEDIPF